MFCSECGTKLAEGARFCEECKTEVADTPQTPNTNNPKNSAKRIFTNKIFIIGVAIVLIAVLAIVFWPGGNSPHAVTKKAFAAIANNDAEAVLNYMTAEEVNWQLSYYSSMTELLDDLEDELFEINLDAVREQGKNWNKKLKFTTEFSTDSQASVRVDLPKDEGSVSVILIKEEGKWKIKDFIDF